MKRLSANARRVHETNLSGEPEELLRKEFTDLYGDLVLSSLLNKIAEKVKVFLECGEASIFLYDPVKEELYFEIATGEKEKILKQIVHKKGEGIVGWVAAHEEAIISNDCAADPRFSSRSDRSTNFITRSIVGVPVFHENRFLGVLEAINKKDGLFEPRHLNLLKFISRFVAIPLENAVLFKKITQETRDKDRLLELAKTISYSGGVDDVLNHLKQIICDIMTPIEINVLFLSGGRRSVYKLLGGSDGEVPEYGDETHIDQNSAVFPLKSRDRRLGVLEIKADKRIPPEVISMIRGLAAFVAIMVDRLEMHAQIVEREKLEKELQIARDIQQSFLPKASFKILRVEAAFFLVPSSAVGGDFLAINPLDDQRTVFSINDVSGHGIPASLLMSIFCTNFVYRLKRDKNIVDTLEHLNRLIAETTEAHLYVTSFTCLLDTGMMELRYINAAHNAPFILRGEEAILLSEGSMAVGMFDSTTYSMTAPVIYSGDMLVMYTDGVVEAENPEGEAYGLMRLIEFIRSRRVLPCETIKDLLIEDLRFHVQGRTFVDDITAILVRVL